MFAQAGVTAIACYRPCTLLGWQELRSPAITQHQSFPGKVAADNGGFMDCGGTLLVVTSGDFAAGKHWKLVVLIKGGEAMQSAKVGVRC